MTIPWQGMSHAHSGWCYSDSLKRKAGAAKELVIVAIDENQREQAGRAAQTTASFEAVFREHWGRVYGVLFRLVGDRQEAEALALEAFWRLHRRGLAGAKADAARMDGWLYRVATNLGLNALRARKRRARYEDQAGRMRLENEAFLDPVRESEKAEEREQVRRALGRIKPRSARLLVLRHSGLSYAEVASAVGVRPGSVGALLARAEREFEEEYLRLTGGEHREEVHDASA